MTFLTTKEIAFELGLARATVQKYIREGFLPATLVTNKHKTQYKVELDEYHHWKEKHFQGLSRGKISKYTRLTKDLSLEDIRDFSNQWIDWCSKGKLTGRIIAPRTAELYSYYFGLFLNQLPKYPVKPIIGLENVRYVLGEIPVEKYSTRLNIYSSVMSFTKFLVEIGKSDVASLQEIKKLRPRRFLPAKKTRLTEQQLNNFLAELDNISGNLCTYENLTSKTIIATLAYTGLRNSELCNLRLKDLDLEARRIYVWLGKGNKNRVVGITTEAYKYLEVFLRHRLKKNTQSDYLFISRKKQAFKPEGLSHKIQKLGKRLNLDITPHGLRRTFVTMNVNKGRPLVHLQIACGHSDISTTRQYAMTSEDEVIEAMSQW